MRCPAPVVVLGHVWRGRELYLHQQWWMITAVGLFLGTGIRFYLFLGVCQTGNRLRRSRAGGNPPFWGATTRICLHAKLRPSRTILPGTRFFAAAHPRAFRSIREKSSPLPQVILMRCLLRSPLKHPTQPFSIESATAHPLPLCPPLVCLWKAPHHQRVEGALEGPQGCGSIGGSDEGPCRRSEGPHQPVARRIPCRLGRDRNTRLQFDSGEVMVCTLLSGIARLALASAFFLHQLSWHQEFSSTTRQEGTGSCIIVRAHKLFRVHV